MPREITRTKNRVRSFTEVEAPNAAAAEPAKANPKFISKLRRAGLILLLALLGVGLFLAFRPATPIPPPVLLLQSDFPKDGPTLFQRFVPMKPGWAWAWKMREFIVGQPRRMDMSITVMDCPELPENPLSRLPREKASYTNGNGLQVWTLVDADLAGVRESLKQLPGSRILSRPRISTSSGVGCNLQTDKTTINLCAYSHPERTDLYAHFIQAEDVAAGSRLSGTNLNLGLRLQVPNGSSILILNRDLQSGRKTAVSVSLSFPQQQQKPRRALSP